MSGERGIPVGCLSVVFASLAVGFVISALSVIESVRYVGSGIWSVCPDGFVAGSPLPFVEYDGGGVDPNNTPSSLLEFTNLGGTRTDFCGGSYVLNSVYWSLPALAVFSFVAVIVRATRSGFASGVYGGR